MNKRSKQSEKAAIIGETKALAISNYAFQGISMIRGLVIAKVLGPSLYGFWSILNVCFSSARLLGAGSTSAMVRQVPLNQGRGRSDDNTVIHRSCLTWYLLSSSTVALIGFAATFWMTTYPYLFEIRLACIVFIFYAMRMFSGSKLTSERKIYILSRLNLVYAFTNAVLGISLVFFWGIKGVLVGMLSANTVVLAILFSSRHLSLRLGIDFSVFFKLIRMGFPIMILSMTFLLMQSIDKFIIYSMLGSLNIGYFGLASFLSEVINYIPGALNVVLFPRIMHTLGQTNDRRQIEKYYQLPVFFMAATMPILVGVIYINIDWAIAYFLPKYIPSIKVLKIFSLGLFFFTIWGIPRNLLIAFGKQRQTLLLVLGCLLLGAIADITVIRAGWGIEGVALTSLLVFSLIATAANVYVLVCLHKSRRALASFMIKIFTPFVYSLAGILLIDRLSIEWHPIIADAARSFLYLIYMVPLVCGIEKRLGIYRDILRLKSE